MKYVRLLIDIKQDTYGNFVDILLPKDNGHSKSQLTLTLVAQPFKTWQKSACLEASLGNSSGGEEGGQMVSDICLEDAQVHKPTKAQNRTTPTQVWKHQRELTEALTWKKKMLA